jgi:hypothetical protein
MTTKVHQIRREFDEPFRDVVAGFAQMGYSRRATAEILEINRSYFVQHLLPRYANDVTWRPQREMRKECRPPGRGWPKGVPQKRRPRYSDEELLRLVAKCDTANQFTGFTGIWSSTVVHRFGSWSKAKTLAKEITP